MGDENQLKDNNENPPRDHKVVDPMSHSRSNPPPPPVAAPDGGWGWVVVVASFFISFIVDGVCNTFGVIKGELDSHFDAPSSTTAWAGSLLSGVYMIIGPVAGALANKFGCRIVCLIGSAISGVFIFISGFSVNIDMLLITYGVVGGIGFGLMYLPAIVMVGYYFDKRRALAVGIAVCGTGIGTVVMAPVVSFLIEQFTWRGANMIIGGFILNGLVFGAFYRPLVVQTEKEMEIEDDWTIATHNGVAMPNDDVSEYFEPDMFSSRTSLHNEDIPLVLDDDKQGTRSRHSSSTAARSRHTSTAIAEEKKPLDHVNHVNGEDRVVLSHSTTLLSELSANCHDHDTVQNGVETNDNVEHPSRSRCASFRTARSRHTSTRSVTVIEEKKPFDRPDALVTTNLSSTREFHACGDNYAKYYGSMKSLHTVVDSKSPLAVIKTMFDLSLLKSPTVILICVSGFLSFAGFYTPFVYIPAKSESLGTSAKQTSVLLSVMGATNTVFRAVAGFLADRPCVDGVLFHNVAIILAGVVTCLVCVCNTWELLMIYAALFGTLTAAFVTLRSIIIVELLGISKLNSAFGLMCLVQGLAAMIGSPMSGAMLDYTESFDLPFIVSGILFALSGIVCLPIRRVARWELSKNECETKRDSKRDSIKHESV